MATPTLSRFVAEVDQIIQSKDGIRLSEYLILEPPLPPLYQRIVAELKQHYPANRNDSNLEEACKNALPSIAETNTTMGWSTFLTFFVQYLMFLRDVDPVQLVETHDLLKALLSQCILALSNNTMGVVILPTVISLSRTLTRLAIGLDMRPELVEHLAKRASIGVEEGSEKVTLVESSANTIREAFKKCLSERNGNPSGLGPNGKPEGRRIGIYLTANLCLKLFFRCKKIRNAEQIFGNIYQHSPPLSLYPASQRVTYLYYLGRYLFANSHFFRAQAALQAAYDQCRRNDLKQRRQILIYLITSNIILGRFPTPQLLMRPEAKDLTEIFFPICQAISRGDLYSFHKYLDIYSPTVDWFLKKRVLIQLRNRCEVLVWRSLVRKTFLISGFHGDASQVAPNVDLQNILAVAALLQRRVYEETKKEYDLHVEKNESLQIHEHDEYDDVEAYDEEDYGTFDTDPDLYGIVEEQEPEPVTMMEIEGVLASLIEQGLLHGYLSLRQLKFVIQGAKAKPAQQAGFPNAWEILSLKSSDEVPGWVDDQKPRNTPHNFDEGSVIHLSGARAVGNASS